MSANELTCAADHLERLATAAITRREHLADLHHARQQVRDDMLRIVREHPIDPTEGGDE